jgi:hypothetical protein
MATKKHFERKINIRELYTGEARCEEIGDHIFFEEVTDDTFEFSIKAKKICATCPLLEKCRDYALQNRVLGVWGGMSFNERANYWRKHNIIPENIILEEAS